MNTNQNITVEKDISQTFQELSTCANNQDVRGAESRIQEIIELFREVKRQNKTVDIKEHSISVEGVTVCDGLVIKMIKSNIEKFSGQGKNLVKPQFLNFVYNLNHFNQINEENWNGQAVINQKCGNDGDFKNFNVGLNNIGATCVMNSTMQCLFIALMFYFGDPIKRQSVDNTVEKRKSHSNFLLPSFLDMFDSLMRKVKNEGKGEPSFSPNNFVAVVEQMNSLFKQGQPGDAKDFIIYILEQIHKDTQKSVVSSSTNNNLPLNQYDRENELQHFFHNTFGGAVSVISDHFFGITEITNVCQNCKQNFNSKGINEPICYNHQVFNLLIFPLDEVWRNIFNKGQVLFMHSSGAPIVTLKDAFEYYTKTELFCGPNQNYCNICKQLYDSEHTNKIFSLPSVLPIILNRGKDNMYNVKLDVTKYLDTNDTFVLNAVQQDDFYELQSSIHHLGQSGPNAHFVANGRSPIDGKFWRYNDALVNPIKKDDFNKDIAKFGIPYILFYSKMSDERKLSKTLDFLSKNAQKNQSKNPSAMDNYVYYSNKMRDRFKQLKAWDKANKSDSSVRRYTYLLGFCWMNRTGRTTDMYNFNISEDILCDTVYETFNEIENTNNFDSCSMKKLKCKIEMRVWLATFPQQRGNIIGFIDSLSDTSRQSAVCDLLLYAATRRICPVYNKYMANGKVMIDTQSTIPYLIYAVFDMISGDTFTTNTSDRVAYYKSVIDSLACQINSCAQQGCLPDVNIIENIMRGQYCVSQFRNTSNETLIFDINNSYNQNQNPNLNNNIINNNININNNNNQNLNNNTFNNVSNNKFGSNINGYTQMMVTNNVFKNTSTKNNMTVQNNSINKTNININNINQKQNLNNNIINNNINIIKEEGEKNEIKKKLSEKNNNNIIKNNTEIEIKKQNQDKTATTININNKNPEKENEKKQKEIEKKKEIEKERIENERKLKEDNEKKQKEIEKKRKEKEGNNNKTENNNLMQNNLNQNNINRIQNKANENNDKTNNLKNNNPQNDNVDIEQIVNNSENFADFCGKLKDKNVAFNQIDFSREPLGFWNCCKALFLTLCDGVWVDCNFWQRMCLRVFYENAKSNGGSYCFVAYNDPSHDANTSNETQDQKSKNIERLSVLIQEAQEKANENPNLEDNSKNPIK